MKYTRSEILIFVQQILFALLISFAFEITKAIKILWRKVIKFFPITHTFFFLQIIRYLVTQQKKCLILNEKTKNGTKLSSDINLYGQWYFIHYLSFRYKLTWIRNYRERYWQKLWNKQSLFGAWGHKVFKQETKNEEGWRERGAYF